MNQLHSAFTLFLSLLVEAIPFLLLGVLFSSFLLIFVDERKLVASLPKNPLFGALSGGMVGFLFPVCECGNVPVARRLLIQGAPAPVAIGFLLAAPTINPIVIWSTWIAFRDQPEIVFWRVGLTLAIATLIGWLFSTQKDIRPLLQPNVANLVRSPEPEKSSGGSVSPLLQSGTFLIGQGESMRFETATATAAAAPAIAAPNSRFWLFLENAVQELRELGGVLILGSAIAASIQIFVPREVILGLGQGPITSIVAMMLLAAIVSICSTVDSFFALSFASAFTGGSLLAFLIFGPMIDLKAIGLMMSLFRGRAIAYIFVIAAQLTFLATLFLNLHVS